jgi:hypothetical protein
MPEQLEEVILLARRMEGVEGGHFVSFQPRLSIRTHEDGAAV